MTWMLTASGRRFDLANPDPAAVHIDDIALALSHVCRFGGHTTRFYSVAEHCVHASYLIDSKSHAGLKLMALLHDAHEAYTGDRISPLQQAIKESTTYDAHRDIEADVQAAIEQALVPADLLQRLEEDEETDRLWTAAIKHADLQMLAAEKAQVMPQPLNPADGYWPCLEGIADPGIKLDGWSTHMAAFYFVTRYHQLLAALYAPAVHAPGV